MVFLKEFFKKDDFEKNQQKTTRSMQNFQSCNELSTYNKFFKLGIQLILISWHRDIHGHRLEWCPLVDPILDVGWSPSETPAETLLTWHCQARVTEWLELSEHHLKKKVVLFLKAPIMTAADDKFCDIFLVFDKNKV